MKHFKRLLSFFLCVAVFLVGIPLPSLAYLAPVPDQLVLTTSGGARITPDSTWETTFPYGTFAFATGNQTVTEGGESKVTVYRLGGTSGRATAFVTYVPAAADLQEGERSYANAAGSADVAIRVENPLPIAAYQPVGKAPNPLVPDEAVSIERVAASSQDPSPALSADITSDGSTEESPADGEGDPLENGATTPVSDTSGDVTLQLTIEAEAYQWQIFRDDMWEDVSGATDRTFVATQEELEAFDFLCVFTLNNVRYGSDSVKGIPYVAPEPEVLPDMPPDLELEPEVSYSVLSMDNPDPYAGYLFPLTFADGEWVKDILVSSAEDDAAEPDKFGMFTIVDCVGGTLYDAANTLLLHVQDNEAALASTIGFDVTAVSSDKATGTATLKVKRTGGTKQVLSVAYETVNGSARSGRDYAAVSGTLIFYADITEQTIVIPLIDDGVETDQPVSFQVILKHLRGDKEGICSISPDAAEVSLYNSGDSRQLNLESLLYNPEVEDLSGTVADSDSVMAPEREAVAGTQVDKGSAYLPASIPSAMGKGGEVDLQTYNYPYPISFNRGSSYNGWRNDVYVANNNGSFGGDVNNLGGFSGSGWSGGSSYGSGWKVESKGSASAVLSIANMNRMYSRFRGYFAYRAAIGSSLYDLEYTYPWFRILNSNGSTHAYEDAPTWGEGDFWSGTKIWWYESGYLDSSWSMTASVNRLQLGLSRYDCHDANSTALSAIRDAVLTRRVFQNRLNLRIHTANDGGSGVGGVRTAPVGAASLMEASGVYDSMIPEVSVEMSAGGINSNGQIYVGSKLKVTLKNTPSFSPAKETDETGYDDLLDYAVYLTNANGTKVATSQGSGNVHYLTLLWNGMNEADLSGQFSVNVVMTRKQTLKIDLSPSVPRLTDENGSVTANIDPTQIDSARNAFWDGTTGVTYGYSTLNSTAPHFAYNAANEAVHTGTLTAGSFTSTSTGTTDDAILELGSIRNLQWINFNQSADDIVLYNGRAYKGNERIWLTVSDLANAAMTFRFYDEAYLTAPSVMTTDISQTGLYFDANGNGRIDGWYNQYTGYFVPDPASGDRLMFFLEPGVDYDESLFSPVAVYGPKESDPAVMELKGYHHYFLKSFYTMTPRSLTIPEGHTEAEYAQVMPAFIADVSNPATYAALTDEQQAYRYVVSGLNRSYLPTGAEHNVVTPQEGDYTRSADGHLMFGAAANKVSLVDIPLGGDTHPPVLDAVSGTFSWEPEYHGNLLYRFNDPDPIYIPHSLAGDNIPVAAVSAVDLQTGVVTFLEGAAIANGKLNGYLGSFTGNDTYSLSVQEQVQTTDQIAAQNGVTISIMDADGSAGAALPAPESVRLSSSGCFPNADYLKENKPGGSTGNTALDMSGSGNSFDEFNLGLGVKLPSAEIGVSDYVTITMDEYEVGFSIGIPLGGYNSNGDAGTGGPGSTGGSGSSGGSGGSDGSGSGDAGGSKWFGPSKANKSNAEDMGKMRDFIRKPSMDSFKNTDDSYKNAKDLGQMKSSSFSVEFAVSLGVIFKYNPLDNAYYFSQFSVAVSAALEYRYQQRLTPCPIVYLYVTVGIEVEIGTGMSVDREAVEETGALLPEAQAFTLQKGQSYNIPLSTKAFNITFSGKLYLECFKQYTEAGPFPTWSQADDEFSKGFIKSDGDEPVTVTLFKQDKTALDTPRHVRVTALENTTLTRVARVVDVRSDVYWNGLTITPEAFIEAGVGVGVEIAKIEVFIRLSISCGMTLGDYNKETKEYDSFTFEELEMKLALGFRVVLLVFSYEMDLISYSITYDHERKEGEKWVHSWAALGGLYGEDIGSLSVMDSSGQVYPVRIKLPGSTAATQTVYGPMADGEIGTLAYGASDPTVPFQLSGYGTSGDAYKLADGLITGYEYQVVSVGDENFVVYTLGRDKMSTANEVDYSMLVMSRLKLTRGEGGQADTYGLVHPVTGAPAGYVPLDAKVDGTDEGTGDLGFQVWVDNQTIHAAWVSYASVSAAAPVALPEPVLPVPTSGGFEMDQTNYSDAVLFPGHEPVAPMTPVGNRPVPAATEPVTVKPAGKPVASDYIVADTHPDGTTNPAYLADKALWDAWEAWELQQEWDVYDEAYAEYLTDLAAYHAHVAWVAYFDALVDVNAYVQTRAANAAKNTVVKTASFTVLDAYLGTERFSTPVVVSAATGSHVFLPDATGNGTAVFHARATHYTPEEEAAAKAAYDTYLLAAYPGADASASIRNYRATYQKGLRDAYGKRSTLHVSVKGSVVGAGAALADGEVLENIEVLPGAVANTYCLAYTTGQQTYVGTGASQNLLTVRRLYLRSVSVADPEGTPVVTWGTAKLLRTLKDYDRNDQAPGLDGVYSASSAAVNRAYNEPYFANLQGLYGKLGTLPAGEVAMLADPEPEHFLLFEMNGSTWLVPAADLASITSIGTGQLYPFFKPQQVTNDDGTHATATTQGRAEVTIGADGAGNLTAVYTGSMPNTGSNALFLSRYDSLTGTWGTGSLLAMNHMQVFEDATTKGWSAEQTEKAYLGQRPDGLSGGGMDQFKFYNVQIALGQQDESVSAGSLGAGETLMLQAEVPREPGQVGEEAPVLAGTASAPVDPVLADLYGLGRVEGVSLLGDMEREAQLANLDEEAIRSLGGDPVGTRDTLLVLTQGLMTYLKTHATAGIVPQSDEEAHATFIASPNNRKPGVGMYAISYGVGAQRIGEDLLRFLDCNFTPGSELQVQGAFINTGDVALRGSAANPIEVTLSVITPDKNTTDLCAWEITEPVIAGQQVSLSGSCTALTQTLPTGSVFYFTVSEDADYIAGQGGTAFVGNTLTVDDAGVPLEGTFKVEQKPELGFESCSVTSTGVDAAGNTILTLDFQVGNRGNEAASGVFVQFTRESGLDANGRPVYVPLDLTGHNLLISRQQALQLMDAPSTAAELQQGILRLYHDEDGSALGVGMGRTVTGTLTVPASAYCGSITGSLNLNMEIFSGTDAVTVFDRGVLTANHDEYYTVNNAEANQLEHATYLYTADKVTLAMGNTMRLPVSVATTTGRTPRLIATEQPDGNDGQRNLGILYYEDSGNSYADGNGSGTLVLAPSREGSGIIHLTDTATNTIVAIAYNVTPYAEGINIFRDNSLFTFHNAGDTPGSSTHDPSQVNQDWVFRGDVPVWGTGDESEAPYLNNLADGSQDAFFQFRTVSEGIRMFFEGTIRIESTFPEFAPVTLTSTGGSSHADVRFGANSTLYAHTVTITVLSQTGARFDRLVEQFAGGAIPKPADDAAAPHVYWNRSFPDTASIDSDFPVSIPLTCYVLDDTGLAAVTLNGETPSLTRHDAGFWSFPVTVTGNGTLSVSAQDSAGNRTARSVTVDWYNPVVSVNASHLAPSLDNRFELAGGALVSTYINQGETAWLKATSGTAGAVFSASHITAEKDGLDKSALVVTALTPAADGRYPVVRNGYYQVVVRSGDAWRTELLLMDKVDTAQPEVTLTETVIGALEGTPGRALSWSAAKGDATLSSIVEVTLNGIPLPITPNQTWLSGTVPLTHGGLYVLRARDAADNISTEAVCTVSDFDLDVSDAGVFDSDPSWNQLRTKGILRIDFSKVGGGLYNPVQFASDQTYAGRYEWRTTPVAPVEPAELARWLSDRLDASEDTGWTTLSSIGSLAPGQHQVLVRDASDKRNAEVVAQVLLTVADAAVTANTAVVAATGWSEAEANGKVEVQARAGKGGLGTWQFALIPMKDEKTPPVAPSDVAGLPGEKWEMVNPLRSDLSIMTFDGLQAGWYQLVVRSMQVPVSTLEGLATRLRTISSAERTLLQAEEALQPGSLQLAGNEWMNHVRVAMEQWDSALLSGEPEAVADAESAYRTLVQNHAGLLDALAAWRTALDAVTGGTGTQEEADAAKRVYDRVLEDQAQSLVLALARQARTDAETARELAVSAYELALLEAETTADQAYAVDPTLWDNAVSLTVKVPFIQRTSSGGTQIPPDYTRQGEVFQRVDNVNPVLSPVQQAKLIEDNATRSVLVGNDHFTMILPVGSLQPGDNLNDRIIAHDGTVLPSTHVVRYTDAGGVTHVVQFSALVDGKLLYVAEQSGTYELVENGKMFTDAAGHWADHAIGFVTAHELFLGTGKNVFSPELPMTRAMFVTVMGRLAAMQAGQTDAALFGDVSPGTWYADAVAWAIQNGIVSGYGNGQFGPNDTMTREQMCVMLARMMDAMGISLPSSPGQPVFRDMWQVSSWARKAVLLCQQSGLVEGNGQHAFHPGGTATRAQVATIIQRFVQKVLLEGSLSAAS